MIPCQKHLFNIPEDFTYLNCAYLSPQLCSVSKAGQIGVARKEHPWQVTAENFFSETEMTRGLFARIIDSETDDIAIIPAVSYGMSVVAKNVNVKKNDAIVVLEDQFPSNVYPWRELAKEQGANLRTVARPENADLTDALLNRMDKNTAIVALPGCHWTDGALIDLVKIGSRCREIQATFILDATQSLGALPFSVREVQPDFLIAAGYKWLFGPYSLGFMYVSPCYQGGKPLEHNWINRKNSQDFAGLVNYRDEFQPGARRFDVGERSNFVLMPMAKAALQQILDWKVSEIASTLSQMTNQIADRANELGLNVAPAHQRAGHMLGLRLPEKMSADLVDRLSEKKIYVSVRGNSIRVSPHLYNTGQDIEKFLKILSENI
ncbi:MAG: aminotransferase class V-fold PLP-dependent enzyme [Desulfobacterales bacterium]|jgi:selenocysteine lyase/cysteine desulfurase|nr:aminotransferase [Desulfobacter sp.]MDP6394508.1 aminotransferase class V-fold PLP-dependent enzyme [Desulfobacterales bacterium]MDP6683805.1 aminotransferase class V-fold PLP-dependent enzyme [Desulfobacterales bacterium]MDP6806194.1 aminotransferase class V-fold PLP-dependent enzyme [Desulfobacterales bacterium]|tara:strand:- start:91972 stop:93105 length:1134 start_codon:yes stop_codon:yes gene_type:complete